MSSVPQNGTALATTRRAGLMSPSDKDKLATAAQSGSLANFSQLTCTLLYMSGLNTNQGSDGGASIATALKSTGQAAFSWNRSAGQGETTLYLNRASGVSGGFEIADVDNAGSIRRLLYMDGLGYSTFYNYVITPTAPAGDRSQKIATTAFVSRAILAMYGDPLNFM